jgi:hypothetical protein
MEQYDQIGARLPVRHVDIDVINTQTLQAGFYLFADRFRGKVFIQLPIANFVE